LLLSAFCRHAAAGGADANLSIAQSAEGRLALAVWLRTIAPAAEAVNLHLVSRLPLLPVTSRRTGPVMGCFPLALKV
jgi:hypothetical protein